MYRCDGRRRGGHDDGVPRLAHQEDREGDDDENKDDEPEGGPRPVPEVRLVEVEEADPTTTERVLSTLTPALSVTFNVAEKVADFAKVWEGSDTELVEPSPNDQAMVYGAVPRRCPTRSTISVPMPVGEAETFGWASSAGLTKIGTTAEAEVPTEDSWP